MSEQFPDAPPGQAPAPPVQRAQPPDGGNVLTRRLGPLPMWVWVALVAVVIVAWAWWSNRNAPASSADTSTSTDTSGSTTPETVIREQLPPQQQPCPPGDHDRDRHRRHKRRHPTHDKDRRQDREQERDEDQEPLKHHEVMRARRQAFVTVTQPGGPSGKAA